MSVIGRRRFRGWLRQCKWALMLIMTFAFAPVPVSAQDTSFRAIDSSWVAPIAAALTAFPVDTICRMARVKVRKRSCYSVIVIDPSVYHASLSNGRAYFRTICLATLPGSLVSAIPPSPWKFVIRGGFTNVEPRCDSSDVFHRRDPRADTLVLALAIPSVEVRDASDVAIAIDVSPPWGWPGWDGYVWLRRDGDRWQAGEYHFAEE